MSEREMFLSKAKISLVMIRANPASSASVESSSIRSVKAAAPWSEIGGEPARRSVERMRTRQASADLMGWFAVIFPSGS